MTVGDNIKELRLYRNLKQSDLSEMTGISRVTIGNYERGDRIPNTDAIVKIAKALSVPVESLLPALTQEEIEQFDNDKNLKQAITLCNIPTDQLIEELNNRNDFPMKLKLK